MRLTESDITAFISSINEHVTLVDAELRLYGSRVKDHLKGGDIDLLLILPNAQSYTNVLNKKPEILVSMKDKIGDQKIDFTLAKRDQLAQDPFIALILDDSKLLYRWNGD